MGGNCGDDSVHQIILTWPSKRYVSRLTAPDMMFPSLTLGTAYSLYKQRPLFRLKTTTGSLVGPIPLQEKVTVGFKAATQVSKMSENLKTVNGAQNEHVPTFDLSRLAK